MGHKSANQSDASIGQLVCPVCWHLKSNNATLSDQYIVSTVKRLTGKCVPMVETTRRVVYKRYCGAVAEEMGQVRSSRSRLCDRHKDLDGDSCHYREVNKLTPSGTCNEYVVTEDARTGCSSVKDSCGPFSHSQGEQHKCQNQSSRSIASYVSLHGSALVAGLTILTAVCSALYFGLQVSQRDLNPG